MNYPITVIWTARDEPQLRPYKAERTCRTVTDFNATVDRLIADDAVINVAAIDADGEITLIFRHQQ